MFSIEMSSQKASPRTRRFLCFRVVASDALEMLFAIPFVTFHVNLQVSLMSRMMSTNLAFKRLRVFVGLHVLVQF